MTGSDVSPEDERWTAHQSLHDQLDKFTEAARQALRERLEQSDEHRRLLDQQAISFNQRALDAAVASMGRAIEELKRTTEKQFDGVDEFRLAFADQMAGYPTRAESQGQLAAVTVSIASLSEKLSAMTTQIAEHAGTYVTKEQLDAQERVRETDRRESRRAIAASGIAAALSVIGWIITLVLTLGVHHG